ncbi:fibronectin type III domain-containing protein [Microbacterium sp. SORGH_AS_0888]|uniref:fibronectin type III domain-containing protein n=1 Tax=Microbacterium sp. SORGH_AS_0888 TaxID=3041791 RepID=UPI00278B5202|nr:fibronectin type III domain-containing protein [Microbacterium sp. SORGH_AS_0888]MDQ1130337.1 hypothetical protein [Microbacterium sp. SORGH_AS_0888]
MTPTSVRHPSTQATGRTRTAVLSLLGTSAVVASLLLPAAAHADDASVYYAAPDGSATGDCTASQPCSIERAQEVVRADTTDGDVTVQLADGTYRVSEPLRFDAQDGGGDHVVRWTAADGAHPVISGASAVTGWHPSDVGRGIWVADTPTGLDTRQLVVDGVLAPRAAIRLANTDVTPTATGLTIENSALSYLAELPDQGRIEFETLGDFTNRYTPVQSISATEITMAQPAWDNNTWGWDTVQNSFLAGPSWYLDNSLAFLTQTGQWYIDPDDGKLYYKPAEGVDPNDLDVELPRLATLLSIGGTYDEPVSGLAFEGIQFSGTSWLGPSADGYAGQQNGAFLKGAYDYRPADAFTSCSRGCEMFERARTSWFQEPAAVQVSAATRVSFTGNTFTGLGQSALGIGNDANAHLSGVGLGASSIEVIGNRFFEDSGHGIAVGGVLPDAHHPSDPRMTNRDILIRDNTVSRVSVDYRDNSGILSTYVTNAQILHNEVSNVPYDGIDTGYGWGINDAGGSDDYLDRGYYNWNTRYTTPTTLRDNRVEGNLVHNTKARFADGGSVYNLSASPGSVVAKNYLFNISGVGLYLDEGSRSMTYENNVVQGGSFVFTNAYSLRNNTSDNVIQNNWYNSGGVSAPNAAAHNNTLVNNVKVDGAAWPAAAIDVICAAGVAPEYRTSLNANRLGFAACPTDSPVAADLRTAGASASSSFFGQSGQSYGIAAQGADVWGGGGQRDDQFGSIYRAASVNAQASVTARVVSINDANAWAKSGVMVRNDMTQAGTSAGYAVVAVTGRNGVVFEWDSNGDGYLDAEARANVDVFRPIWVQLARTGTSYTASYSYDGSNFVRIGSPVVLASAAATQDAGMFSTSHDVNQSAINQFDSFSVTAATAPAAPAAPSVALDADAVTVSWDAPADGGSAITGYRVYRDGVDDPVASVDGGTTSATIAGIWPGDTARFSVVAVNAFGESTASDWSAGVTVPDGATAAPATATLSNDNGWDTGLADGAYNVVMNLWWGQNGSLYRLYENGTLIATKQLSFAGSAAQTASVPISGRPNGTYVYTGELVNSKGTTATGSTTVQVTQANPGTVVLSNNNGDGDGGYRVTANLWWGTNATSYTFFEDGDVVAQGSLSDHSPNAQVAQLDVSGKAPGSYTYRVDFTNAAGTTASAPMTVTVTR